jgi:hypothetical protein
MKLGQIKVNGTEQEEIKNEGPKAPSNMCDEVEKMLGRARVFW